MNEKPAFLVLVTWPDGSEGLLFPRPGNVPIADTLEKGVADFKTAREHLIQWAKSVGCKMPVATIRLIRFKRVEKLLEFTL